MMALTTENVLLKLRCKGLENALVNEKKAAKQVNLQLQNDIKQAKKGKKKVIKPMLVEEEDQIEVADVPEVVEAPANKNRRGRQVRLPQRYRNWVK